MKYVTRPKAFDDDVEWVTDPQPSMTIHEGDPETYTGIMNHRGEPIFKCKDPIGFNLEADT